MIALTQEHDVPQALIQALFRYPVALQTALDAAGVAPHELAMWARRAGNAPEIEKLAGWLSVGRQPGYYKPLLEVAAGHLRAGELLEALPVFRWAYYQWQAAPADAPGRRPDGLKLFGLWGECLYRLGQPVGAQDKWLHGLRLVGDAEALTRLARVIERTGAAAQYEAVLTAARERMAPGAEALWQRWQRLTATPPWAEAAEPAPAAAPPADTAAGPHDGSALAVLADVANLELVCGDQFGYGRRPDYGRLLAAVERLGPVRAKVAFVPDLPDTLPVRDHLAEVGFTVELQRPKRSHGRIAANADAAMGATAARWASEPGIGRVELWTGDGDFLPVRALIRATWPHVAVAFRGFPAGTAAEIQRLEADWEPIGPQYLMS